jgi:hypothetical protein
MKMVKSAVLTTLRYLSPAVDGGRHRRAIQSSIPFPLANEMRIYPSLITGKRPPGPLLARSIIGGEVKNMYVPDRSTNYTSKGMTPSPNP